MNSLIDARDRFSKSNPEQRIAVNGREWGVVRAGDTGPALLLIPGTLGRGDIFWQQIEALSGRARVAALTYPATGGVAEWSDDLATLLAKFDFESATVLGSSLGGYLVQHFAGKHGRLVDRLIAANTLASVSQISGRPPYSSDLDSGPIEELRAGFGNGLRAWAKAHPDQSELVELLLAEVGGRIPEPELRTRLNALKCGPELPPINLPRERVVTIEGGDDPLIPPEMREAVRERLNPAVAYRFETGGHFPYVVRPGLYTSLLEEQLGLAVTGESWGNGEVRAK
ncbi:MAG: alpha/beta hydrolase [Rhizobiaceae bacterium]|nr:alpha/beta hydrolase [Rhizobiaceae bacterium]MCV0408998.1 alpha/beta hydrolase [Rhizobiaceae bacterium]